MSNTGTHLLLTVMLMLGLAFPACSSEEESVPDGDAVADADAVSCGSSSCDTADTAVPEDAWPLPPECDTPAPGCRCTPGVDYETCCLSNGAGMGCSAYLHRWGYGPDECNCRPGAPGCEGAPRAPDCPFEWWR